MRHSLAGVVVALAIGIVGPAQAQAQLSPAPPTAPGAYGRQFNALTPDDAYKEGLINRWELERLEGPLPSAFQGPSPNGSRGVEPGN